MSQIALVQIPIWRSLAGGALIGSAAALMILFNGRIAGVSGIIDRVLQGAVGSQGWRIAFLLGLLTPALIIGSGNPVFQTDAWTIGAAGLLVGYGTSIGSGCTSGHGVCGVANLSPRSFVATLTFISVAMVTVFFVHHVVQP
jgi:uncharacterized membrane protein YedE/YeeE